MTVRLDLLCHAATSATRRAAFPADESIEPAAVPSDMPLPRFDRALTSPASRARQTAAALGIEATIDPLLRDCDFGTWAGRSLAEVQTKSPDAVAAWLDDPNVAPHGGESVAALLARIGGWLDGQDDIRARILAVTHAAVVRAALVHALGAPPRAFWRIDVTPLTLTRLSGGRRRWTMIAGAQLDRPRS